MYRIRRKRRQADRDVLRRLVRCGVLDTLAGMSNDRLAGRDFYLALRVAYVQTAAQDQGVLFELRRLRRLLPSRRAAHMGDAQARFACVHTADVLVNELGQVTSRLDPRGRLNQCGQGISPLRSKEYISKS